MPNRYVVAQAGVSEPSESERRKIAEQCALVLCKIASDQGGYCQFFLEIRSESPGKELWQIEVKRIGPHMLQ